MPLKMRWIFRNSDPVTRGNVSRQGKINSLVASLLRARGFDSEEEMEVFLRHKTVKYLHSHWDFQDMKKAVDRICFAIEGKEKVVIYGDYDVDGMTATALLTRVLRRLGARVSSYIPSRQKEGYGLNMAAIDRFLQEKVDLVITVDCGISAINEAHYAKIGNLDLIVTDHHQLSDTLPEALAVINPLRESEGRPDRCLAGVGVAFKLALCLCEVYNRSDFAFSELGLVALGTVADLVPLIGDNRILVNEGLLLLNRESHPGLDQLIEVSGLEKSQMNTGHLAFAIAPRLNACGRLGDGQDGVALLLEDDETEAQLLALKFDGLNRQRQSMESDIHEAVQIIIDQKPEILSNKAIVLAGEDWHGGVIGIVASRISEAYHRPTLLVTFENGVGKGSGRSISGLHLHQALQACEDYLLVYGGHEMAAGFQVSENSYAAFKEAFLRHANETLNDEDMIPIKTADLMLDPALLSLETISELEALAPYGMGNPQPVLVMTNLRVKETRAIGAKQSHLKLMLTWQNSLFEAIGFGMYNKPTLPELGSLIDVMFVPEINLWNHQKKVQLKLKDYRSSQIEPVLSEGTNDPFLESLFEEGIFWMDDQDYRDAFHRETFKTSLKTLFDVSAVDESQVGLSVELVWGQTDQDLILVRCQGENLGLLNEAVSRYLNRSLAAGDHYRSHISGIEMKSFKDEEVFVSIQRFKPTLVSYASQVEEAGHTNEEWIRQAILGSNQYHPKQQEAITALQMGLSTLLILGTGRGKSAVFQTQAVSLATQGRTTILVYPLRALVHDQYHRFQDRFHHHNIGMALATGSMNPEERQSFFKELYTRKIQVVLTTPEFLSIHLSQFIQAAQNIGCLVVDEAHHILDPNRRGYQDLPQTWKALGKPTLLAVTATASQQVLDKYTREMEIKEVITETHIRNNLSLIDARDTKDKHAYLLKLLIQRKRTLIYVNTRKDSYELALFLRKYLPKLENMLAFYHGGLDGRTREQIEARFRKGDLLVLIATSAFGEGVDVPDVRELVLFHPCFSKTEFNQLSGRAGRDGKLAHIHLLYQKNDVAVNREILKRSAPDRALLGDIYLYLKQISSQINPIQMTNQSLLQDMQKKGCISLHEETLTTALGIFEELGLLLREQDAGRRYIHMMPPPPTKLDLNQSSRFLESQREHEAFEEYLELAFRKELKDLQAGIDRPILPQKMI